MRTGLVGLVVAAALVAAPAAVAQAPAGDSITGTGTTGNFFGQFDIDVRSGPAGQNPTGQASFQSVIGQIAGPATCLAVNGNVGVVNLLTPQYGIVTFQITDNAGTGGPDTIQGYATGQNEGRLPADCSPPPAVAITEAVVAGDVTVVDAKPVPTTTDQCKKGGWQSYGVFKNQGDCVSYVATKGKNPPAGQ